MKWHVFIAKDNLITFSLAFSSICYISQLFTVSLNLNHKSIRTIKMQKDQFRNDLLVIYLLIMNTKTTLPGMVQLSSQSYEWNSWWRKSVFIRSCSVGLVTGMLNKLLQHSTCSGRWFLMLHDTVTNFQRICAF